MFLLIFQRKNFNVSVTRQGLLSYTSIHYRSISPTYHLFYFSDFIFDVKDHIVEGHNTSGRQKITFYFMKAIVSFLKVSNIKINAAPYV